MKKRKYIRDEGFYRVCLRSMLFPNGWQVAYWFQNKWWMIYSDEHLEDDDMHEIDENMIEL